MKERFAKLLCVKSLVTLMLTGVFAYMSVEGTIDQNFLTIYTVIIGFYFGTQHERKVAAVSDAAAAKE